LLPAIDRYDGVAYRVVKRLQRLGQYPEDVDLLIVSAKYGVIPHNYPILTYDLRMTPERALEQAKQNRCILTRFLKHHRYSEVFISAGEDYLSALEPFDAWRGAARVVTNKGKIGLQLKGLKMWLLQARRAPSK
jgi:predicted RNA-binding protein